MLKGLGEQIYSMRVNIADAAMSVALVAILLPRFGIAGYVIVLYICEAFNAVCSLGRLMHIVDFRVDVIRWVGRPLAAIVGATVMIRMAGVHYPAADALSLALRLAAAAGVYFLFACLPFPKKISLPHMGVKWKKRDCRL